MNFKNYHSERLLLFIIGLTVVFGSISTFVHHNLLTLSDLPRNLILFTDSFTVPFFIGLTIHGIDTAWWRSRYFRWLIDVPDLNGRYIGTLVSSYSRQDGLPVTMDCVIEVKQNASHLHISAYFGSIQNDFTSSSSTSVSEELVLERNGIYRLYYIFTNETGGLSERLNNHSGTAKFLYFPDKRLLDGEYYNVLGNRGTIKVVFKQADLLGRLVP
jgi:hypothetical protein